VQDLFEEVGETLKCKIVMNKRTHQSSGYGFVLYGCKEHADLAIEKFDGLPLRGKRLKVRLRACPPRGRSSSPRGITCTLSMWCRRLHVHARSPPIARVRTCFWPASTRFWTSRTSGFCSTPLATSLSARSCEVCGTVGTAPCLCRFFTPWRACVSARSFPQTRRLGVQDASGLCVSTSALMRRPPSPT